MSTPYRASVPFPGGGKPYPYTAAPQPSPFIEAGTLTFTKEKNKMGYHEYCIYRAEPRTVFGPSGPVEGMQWMLVEKVDRPPLDAWPAAPDVYATFGRKISEAEYQRNVKEWEHECEKGDIKQQQRIRKDWEHEQARMARLEEKISARHIKEWATERRMAEEEDEEEEWGAGRGRQRRPSDAGYAVNYARARSRSRVRANSLGEDELIRQLGELKMDRPAQSRSRKVSFGDQAPRAEYARTRRASQSYASNAASYDPGVPVGGPPVHEQTRYSKSPYPREAQLPLMRRGNVAVYPPGHIKEGQPIPGFMDNDIYSERPPRSPRIGSVSGSYRSRSPMPEGAYPYRGSSPRPRSRRPSMSGSVNELPIAFSRAPSHAVSYTPFKAFPILRDLDILWDDGLPPLPVALLPHDIHHDEWTTCLNEVKRAWSYQADVKKRDKMVAKILDIWNAYFFIPRKVELLFLKGSQHRSGPHVGLHDPELGGEDYLSDESESSLSSDEFDLDESFGWYNNSKYESDPWMAQISEARRARKERKLKQKRKRSHRKGNELPYSLYLTCVEDEQSYRYDRRSSYTSVPALI